MEDQLNQKEKPDGIGWVWDEKGQYWYRVRKMTPKEALSLMGLNESEISKLCQRDEKGKQIISDTQLYKLAGNSIVKDVLYYVFKNLFLPDKAEVTDTQLSLF